MMSHDATVLLCPCQTARYSRSQWYTMLMICCACACFTARHPRSGGFPEGSLQTPNLSKYLELYRSCISIVYVS